MKAGQSLRWVSAFVHVRPEAMRSSRYADDRNAPIRCPGLPLPVRYDNSGVFWIEATMTGVDEFNAYLGRVLPDAEVLEIEISPSFAEMHPNPSNSGEHHHAGHHLPTRLPDGT